MKNIATVKVVTIIVNNNFHIAASIENLIPILFLKFNLINPNNFSKTTLTCS